jgi:uncharacterized protein with HEPN domain
MMKDDSVYLRHILDAIAQIESYLDGVSADQFQKTRLIQDGVLRQLEIMGEACRYLSDDIRQDHPEVPWRQIVGLRNRVIHAYFSVNTEIIWEITKDDLPSIKGNVTSILDSLEC